LKIPLKSGKIKKTHFIMGDAEANSASPFFFFSPFFPDGRCFGSARMEQYADVAQMVRAFRQ
jgi:hypothetical protein